MRGTLPAYEERVRELLKNRLGSYAEAIARAYRGGGARQVEGGACPACVNHEAETAFVRRCAAMVLGKRSWKKANRPCRATT